MFWPLLRPRKNSTLRWRLLLVIGLILIVCQTISVWGVWHESKEQIALLVNAALDNHNPHQHMEKEIHEAIISLALPSIVMILVALFLCFQAITSLTRPLSELQKCLEDRGEEQLTSVDYHSSLQEIDAVTHAINRLVSRLSASLERERMFTADVAHELRTPLAGLRLHLELLERTHQCDVKPLMQRLDQMTSSVTQLLQLARAGQSFSSGSYQNVRLVRDVVEPMKHEFETMLALHQQVLILNMPHEVVVRGDVTLLKVMLRNLVENAHRYSPHDTCITIRISKQPSPVLMVEDEGVGIDESKIGELSRAFVRMDRRFGGIGLGLSIVTRIVQLHKGQFLLENRGSVPGCRARVTFTGQ